MKPIISNLLKATTVCSLLLVGCGNSDQANSTTQETPIEAPSGTPAPTPVVEEDPMRETNYDFLTTPANGVDVDSSNDVVVDYSNINDGYINVKYAGDKTTVQVWIIQPDGQTTYRYPLEPGDFHTLPLTEGNGTYQVQVYVCAFADNYTVNFSKSYDVTINDELLPFLNPNQYVDYKKDTPTTDLGIELSKESEDDLAYVGKVFNYVCENVTYDYDFANSIPVNYCPNPDVTMEKKTGICFDYASLMSSLLRSQNIPTKLKAGYAGDIYHAWISVYLKEIGWVENMIQFDGENWSIVDPTLAANNESKEEVKNYMANKENYQAFFQY